MGRGRFEEVGAERILACRRRMAQGEGVRYNDLEKQT